MKNVHGKQTLRINFAKPDVPGLEYAEGYTFLLISLRDLGNIENRKNDSICAGYLHRVRFFLKMIRWGKKFGAPDQKSTTEKKFVRMNAGRAAGLVA